jgi:hypothetical protein
MDTQPAGERFQLLLYGRQVSRFRRTSIILAVLFFGLWYPVSINYLPWPTRPADKWLLAGGLVCLAYWLFTMISPRMAYVQARVDQLRIQTPIFGVSIPYQLIHNTRPIQLAKMYPPESLREREYWLLEPFFRSSALGVDLHDWPRDPDILKRFLNPFFLAPDQTGLVLIIDDWMALSNQLQSRFDTQRAERVERPRHPGISASDILRED